MTDASGWVVERHRGPAAHLHGLEWPDPLIPTLWVMDVTRPALVVGSTQPMPAVDDGAIDVVRRHSGGGAVMLEPGRVGWIDVLLPAGHPRWDDDVGRSFDWVGEAWVAALATIGTAAEAHRGPLVRTRWSDQVCFAGLGPGEVSRDGRKIVGLSQRRTRAGARIQTLVLAAWEPAPLERLLGLQTPDLGDVAAGVGTDRLEAVIDAFVAQVRTN